ncbi:MAG: metalloregulator ArsR/SmtB family transcription factor [Patescibacteria group bacterium]
MSSASVQKNKTCADCFNILADQTRIRIIDAIKKEQTNVSFLAQAIGLTQPTISYHLKMLDSAGFITKERRGRETYYIFNKNYLCKDCGVFTAPIRT